MKADLGDQSQQRNKVPEGSGGRKPFRLDLKLEQEALLVYDKRTAIDLDLTYVPESQRGICMHVVQTRSR